MYILYEASYDYYEWLDAKKVSNDFEKLVTYAESIMGPEEYINTLAFNDKEHSNLKSEEYRHYWITEIEEL